VYYRWKSRRIVAKIAVWGAEEGTAPPFVHTLADAVTERVDAGELEPPAEEGAVGLPRNGEALSVDEQDRRFTMFLGHPSGATGVFRETPVDYKLVAPEAPVEGNRAFDSALHEASGLLFLASGQPASDARALEAVETRLPSDRSPAELAVRVLLAPRGSETPDPADFRRTHDLPDGTPVAVARPWNADDVWETFVALTRQLQPLLEEACEKGTLPF